MCVCMFVCVYACVRVFTCSDGVLDACVSVYVCVYVCVCASMFTCGGGVLGVCALVSPDRSPCRCHPRLQTPHRCHLKAGPG